jgi:hypothetical protein
MFAQAVGRDSFIKAAEFHLAGHKALEELFIETVRLHGSLIGSNSSFPLSRLFAKIACVGNELQKFVPQPLAHRNGPGLACVIGQISAAVQSHDLLQHGKNRVCLIFATTSLFCRRGLFRIRQRILQGMFNVLSEHIEGPQVHPAEARIETRLSILDQHCPFVSQELPQPGECGRKITVRGVAVRIRPERLGKLRFGNVSAALREKGLQELDRFFLRLSREGDEGQASISIGGLSGTRWRCRMNCRT